MSYEPYDSSTVPRLSKNAIEVKAEEVIEFFNANTLQKAQPTPVSDFAYQLKKSYGMIFRTDVDLGLSPGGKKYLGLFRRKPRTILIDAAVGGTSRMPFVLSHEVGHLMLHSNIDPQKCGYSDPDLQDTQYDLVTGKKLLITPKDWIEWQANQFAAAILMPRATFHDALVDFQKRERVVRNFGLVFLDSDSFSVDQFHRILEALATLYGVNKTNIEYRLSGLGLLVDRRDKTTKHISELLRTESDSEPS